MIHHRRLKTEVAFAVVVVEAVEAGRGGVKYIEY